MFRLFQLVFTARAAVSAICRRFFVLLPMACLVIAGCDCSSRLGHVSAMKTAAARTTRERVDSNAEASKGITVAEKAIDKLIVGTIAPLGIVAACVAPSLLIAWLMLQIWQPKSAHEVDVPKDEVPNHAPLPPFWTDEIWRNLKPVTLRDNRVLPETAEHYAWMEDT